MDTFLYTLIFLVIDLIMLHIHKKYIKNIFNLVLGNKKIEELNLQDAEEFKSYSGAIMLIVLTLVFTYYTLKELSKFLQSSRWW